MPLAGHGAYGNGELLHWLGKKLKITAQIGTMRKNRWGRTSGSIQSIVYIRRHDEDLVYVDYICP